MFDFIPIPPAPIVSAWATIFIAAGALRYSIRAGREQRQQNELSMQEQRKHNRLSVLPALSFSYDKNGCGFVNNGIGPARICSTKVSVDGQEFDLDSAKEAWEFARALYQNPSTDTAAQLGNGAFITQGNTFDVIIVDENALLKARQPAVEFTVEYESVYGERMKTLHGRWRPLNESEHRQQQQDS